MEAPEKIYLIRNFPTSTSLNTTNDNHLKFRQEWYKSREKEADIEYIRTDVFIGKACEWIRHYQEYPNHGISVEDLIIGFKKYMEE